MIRSFALPNLISLILQDAKYYGRFIPNGITFPKANLENAKSLISS